MIRTLNFTGRRRIPRHRALIALRRESNGAVVFDAELDLAGLSLPDEAHVFVEAYFKTTFMRFRWGTVREPKPPIDTCLKRLSQPSLARFRVKVVEPGATGLALLLAVADHIAPEGFRDNKRGVALFRVNLPPAGLPDEVWILDFDPSGPILNLNPQISGIKEIVRQEAFMALVFPALIRMIFARILDDGIDDQELERDSWQSCWLRFGAQLALAPAPPLVDGKRDEEHASWIDRVVVAWNQRHRTVPNFKSRFGGEAASR